MLSGYRTFRLFGNSAFARATPFVPDGVAICTKGCSHPRQRVLEQGFDRGFFADCKPPHTK